MIEVIKTALGKVDAMCESYEDDGDFCDLRSTLEQLYDNMKVAYRWTDQESRNVRPNITVGYMLKHMALSYQEVCITSIEHGSTIKAEAKTILQCVNEYVLGQYVLAVEADDFVLKLVVSSKEGT